MLSPRGFSLSSPWWGKTLSSNSWLNKFTHTVKSLLSLLEAGEGLPGLFATLGVDELSTEQSRSIAQLCYCDPPG